MSFDLSAGARRDEATPQLVTSPQMLVAVVAGARMREAVALDTEFVWERTFYPRLGLVQLGLPDGETYLLDPVALGDLSVLGRLLEDDTVQKVLHDAVQDLTILARATGATPKNVFDTRLAAGLAGLPSTLSLRRLLEATVGISLTKTESRSDWLQRPLTDAQLAYARDDVRYLCRAARALDARIDERDRGEWLAEELAALDDPALYDERAPDEAFWKVKGQAKLSPKERSVLRSLAAWREERAREVDLPRGHVVADEALLAVVQRRPRAEADAERLGVPRRHAAGVLAALAQGQERAASEGVRLPDTGPEDETLGARVDLLLAYLKGRGLAEGVDPALVGARADIVALAADGFAAGPERHRLLRGWRRAFIGDDLLALLRGDLAIRLDVATGLPGPDA